MKNIFLTLIILSANFSANAKVISGKFKNWCKNESITFLPVPYSMTKYTWNSILDNTVILSAPGQVEVDIAVDKVAAVQDIISADTLVYFPNNTSSNIDVVDFIVFRDNKNKKFSAIKIDKISELPEESNFKCKTATTVMSGTYYLQLDGKDNFNN